MSIVLQPACLLIPFTPLHTCLMDNPVCSADDDVDEEKLSALSKFIPYVVVLTKVEILRSSLSQGLTFRHVMLRLSTVEAQITTISARWISALCTSALSAQPESPSCDIHLNYLSRPDLIDFPLCCIPIDISSSPQGPHSYSSHKSLW